MKSPKTKGSLIRCTGFDSNRYPKKGVRANIFYESVFAVSLYPSYMKRLIVKTISKQKIKNIHPFARSQFMQQKKRQKWKIYSGVLKSIFLELCLHIIINSVKSFYVPQSRNIRVFRAFFFCAIPFARYASTGFTFCHLRKHFYNKIK